MKKDKKWLIDEIRKLPCEVQRGHLKIKAVDILPLIDQLDEPEKVEPLVVPKDLVDFLVCRPLGEKAFLITMIQDLRQFWSETIEGQDLYNFIADNKKQLIEVILGNRSYKIEKEKLYQVIIPTKDKLWKYYYLDHDGGINMVDGLKYVESHTEEFIRSVSDELWQFAMEVTE